MATLLRMPAAAADAQSAIVSEWVVAVNDMVRRGETVLVIETDKALLDVPAETDGVLLRTLADAGQSVPVGVPVAVFGEHGEDVDAFLATVDMPVSDATTAADPHTTPTVAEPNPERTVPAARETAVPPNRASNRRIFASPLARRLAAEHGIDITIVSGTGPEGRITRRDVERRLAAAPAATSPSPPGAAPIATPAGTAEERPARPEQTIVSELPYNGDRIPHTRIRRAIAARLVHSKTTIPHYYLGRSCRLDDLLALRTQINSRPDI